MTAPSRRWRRAIGAAAAGLAGILALGACTMTSSGESGGAPPAMGSAEDAAGEPLGGMPAPTGAPAAPAPGEGNPQQAPAPLQERSLIYSGSMSVRVDDVVAAADRSLDIAIGAGGLVGEDRRTLDDERSEARLTFRVPADRFTTVLDELAKLGEEQTRSIQTQDVTEALIDLEARLATQEASVTRVRALLAQARTIAEIVAIESELTRRTADLDSLKQRQARLTGLVALSTITLTLRGPDAPEPEEPGTGFVAGLKSGWSAFLESVQIVLTVAGWLLPWFIVVGAPLWLVIWLLRRRRPGTAGPLGPTGPGSAGPGSAGPGSTGPGSTGPGSTGPAGGPHPAIPAHAAE